MPGKREREREREVPTRKPWGKRLKCGGKAGVIRGSLRLSLGEREKAMVRNGDVEQNKETKDSPRTGWLQFVS